MRCDVSSLIREHSSVHRLKDSQRLMKSLVFKEGNSNKLPCFSFVCV